MTFLVLLPLTSLLHSEVLILHVQNSDAPSLSFLPIRINHSSFQASPQSSHAHSSHTVLFWESKDSGVIPAQPFLRPFFAPQNSQVGV